jgi:hypothetical protein
MRFGEANRMAEHRKRRRDPSQLGKLIVEIATGQVEDRPPRPGNGDVRRVVLAAAT